MMNTYLTSSNRSNRYVHFDSWAATFDEIVTSIELVSETVYENMVLSPSEYQQDMVAAL